jgi:endonuclease/exonuclease/phosphatase family metal-dependent hydrolase
MQTIDTYADKSIVPRRKTTSLVLNTRRERDFFEKELGVKPERETVVLVGDLNHRYEPVFYIAKGTLLNKSV